MSGSMPKIRWKHTLHTWFESLICLLGECFAQIATLYRNFCRTTTSQQVHYARTLAVGKLSKLGRVPVSNCFFLNKDTRAEQRAIKHTHSWPKIHEYETLASGKIGIDFVRPTCFENLQNLFMLELFYDSCASAAVEASSEGILCSLCFNRLADQAHRYELS